MSAAEWTVAGVLFLSRVAIAIMFFVSASDKFGGDAQEIAMIARLHFPAPAVLERLTGVFELVAGVLIVLGIGSRIAATGLFFSLSLPRVSLFSFGRCQ